MTARVINADVLDGLRTLPDRSVQCVITSPPYYGLRDYGTGEWEGGDAACDHRGGVRGSKSSTLKNDGRPNPRQNDYERDVRVPFRDECGKCGARRVDKQLGLEATPDAYVQRLVDVFREVRRVLRDDGCAFLNLGDSFGPGKQLQGIPWRVAFALQADGWILRSDIVWHKKSAMPESVRDRPTRSHEFVFLLSKRPSYWYDADAIREKNEHPDRSGTNPRLGVNTQPGNTFQIREGERNGIDSNPAGRNKRDVWSLGPESFAQAHFAVMPTKLVEPCVLAGAPAQACGTCGAPWTRVTERVDQGWDGSQYGERVVAASGGAKSGGTERSTLGSSNGRLTGTRDTVGWQPSCSHADGTARGVILDPFCGSGTVGVVCGWHGRDFIGIELSETYAQMARERIALEGRHGGPPDGHKPVSVIPGQIGLLEDVA